MAASATSYRLTRKRKLSASAEEPEGAAKRTWTTSSVTEESQCHDPASKPAVSSRKEYRRSSWLGTASLKNIIVFGGSFSLHEENGEGDDDSCLDDLSPIPRLTWVGQLAQNLPLNEVTRSFAFNGATAADDLSGQMARFLIDFPPKTARTTLKSDDTTYFFFLGTNDCGQTDADVDELDDIVETLLDCAHDLYVKVGARNFVFFNTPPMHRTPIAVETESQERMILRTGAWNESLRKRVADFAAETPRASVFLFSMNAALTAMLDDPEEYDFMPEDVEEASGAIWADELHPTSEVHAVLANVLLKELLRTPDM